jgi:hypothetical protein
VRLEIYDIAGRRVRRLVDEDRPPGQYELRWQGNRRQRAPRSHGRLPRPSHRPGLPRRSNRRPPSLDRDRTCLDRRRAGLAPRSAL